MRRDRGNAISAQKPRAEFREEKKLGVMFPAHKMVKAAIGRLLPMLRQNHLDGCLS